MTQTSAPRELAERIKEAALEVGALTFGDFVLASGQRSAYYFDGRMLTLSARGAAMVARALLPAVRASGAEAIGGPTLGADPMVASVSMLSAMDGGPPLDAFIVRKGEKDHGTGKLIEGPLAPEAKVAIVDDACSTGGSLIHAVDAAEAAGHKVALVACILDRNQGGGDYFRERGYPFAALLSADADGNISVAS
ncbi:MAG: orotate phosphoribosyltransferase [Dehalococcoidia bacterium]|nr:orotate phosphoribosyltransferase [Dehalococcoidia bacterium]